MRRWVMLLPLLLGLCVLVPAAHAAVTWTCTKDFQAVQEGYYEVVGTCSASGSYATGGDALGASATGKDTAQAVCHTNNQTLVDLVISPSSDGALTGIATYAFDHTNFKLQAFCASPCAATQTLTTGAATVNTGCVAASVTASSLVVCTDQTAAAAVKCTPSAGTLTIAGTGSDGISYVVIPNASAFVSECTSGASFSNQKFRFRAVCK